MRLGRERYGVPEREVALTINQAREKVLEVLRLTWNEYNPETDEVDILAWGDGPQIAGSSPQERPALVGFRVAEVGFTRRSDAGVGGSSYMQVDVPQGLAVCAAVERAVIALVEEWEYPFPLDGDDVDELSEQRSELWRLAFLITEDSDRAARIAAQVMPLQTR